MEENCWAPECGASRRKKGVYFHKLPCMPVDAKWRNQIENIVRKYREVDDVLAARMLKGEIYNAKIILKPTGFT